MHALFRIAPLALSILVAAPAAAQEDDVPYWATISVDKVNMRVGPAGTYRIVWVYKREGLPVKVVRKREGWRLVEDPDGARGWMLGRFLKRDRSAIVTGDGHAEMREAASPGSPLKWRIEPGVVGMLGECAAGWCALDVGGHKGFVEEARLWGPGNP
jgi:SH3-like domain-containing protein